MPILPLTSELVLKAYASGIFPMARTGEDEAIYWVEPKARGILPLDGFHVPKRLARTVRQGIFRITVNQAFTQVIEACAAMPRKEQGTWINATIKHLYGQLHAAGHAHSIEAWENDKLAGGLYGVSLGRAFFGESMFSRARDASKVALVHLVARLKRQGFLLLDAQFITDHLEQFGAIEISREGYYRLLGAALAGGEAAFLAGTGEDAGDGASELGLACGFLQSSTQTS